MSVRACRIFCCRNRLSVVVPRACLWHVGSYSWTSGIEPLSLHRRVDSNRWTTRPVPVAKFPTRVHIILAVKVERMTNDVGARINWKWTLMATCFGWISVLKIMWGGIQRWKEIFYSKELTVQSRNLQSEKKKKITQPKETPEKRSSWKHSNKGILLVILWIPQLPLLEAIRRVKRALVSSVRPGS